MANTSPISWGVPSVETIYLVHLVDETVLRYHRNTRVAHYMDYIAIYRAIETSRLGQARVDQGRLK